MTPNNEQLDQLRALYLGTATSIPEETLKAFESALMIERQYSLTKPYIVAENGICELVENGLLTDYFDHWDKQPPALTAILEKWSEIKNEALCFLDDRAGIKKLLSEVEAVGFTFCYGLSFEPMCLVKMPAK